MRYPLLTAGATIGITAPSSGVQPDLHGLMHMAIERMEMKGYHVICGDTVWTQSKAKSAPGKQRADELNRLLQDESIDIIIPPWGGELLIEILEHLDFDAMGEKWILGYSDISVLLLAVTLRTGIATAHGVNFVDLRGEYSDETTARWESVLSTRTGESILQSSSPKFQKEWQHDNTSPCVYHLTDETQWKSTDNKAHRLQGRLLGGCVDVIRHLIGTPYGAVRGFREKFISGEPILWYLENCELNTVDLRRSLVQMRLAGWFDECSGIVFGRSAVHKPVDNYTEEDAFRELSEEIRLPIIYDMDFGHVPPQITLINGALATVEVTENGKGTVLQHFC